VREKQKNGLMSSRERVLKAWKYERWLDIQGEELGGNEIVDVHSWS